MKRLHSLMLMAATALAAAAAPFEATVDYILDNNAELKGQLSTIGADRADAADANALADPSVEFARVWGRHGIGNKLQLDVSQDFEWPGVYSARRSAADQAAAAALAGYEAQRFEKAKEIRALLIELVYVRKQLLVLNELENNYRSLSEAIDKGVRGGELTVLDQRKMQIESFEIDNDFATANMRQQQIVAQLQGMCTLPLDLSEITDYPLQRLLPLQEYLDAVERDPYVAAQAAESQAQAQNARVASMQRMPGFSVGYQHQAEMGDRFNGFTLGMNLPVFQGRNARRAAVARQQAADADREMAVTRRLAEINGTYAEIQLQRDRLEAYNVSFGDNLYLQLLLKAYKGGQISVIEYLSEVHYFHQTMLIYLDTEYNYNLGLSTLNCY